MSNIRDLSNKGGRKGYKGARAESIQDGEDNDGSVGAAGEPETEDEKGGGVRSYNHHVEAAYSVGDPAGDRASEDGGCV